MYSETSSNYQVRIVDSVDSTTEEFLILDRVACMHEAVLLALPSLKRFSRHMMNKGKPLVTNVCFLMQGRRYT